MLCEVVTILKTEMLDEIGHSTPIKPASSASTSSSSSPSPAPTVAPAATATSSSSSSDALQSFAEVLHKILPDVQERLIYRAQLFVRDAIAAFEPAPSDLDYPNKLKAAPAPQPSAPQPTDAGKQQLAAEVKRPAPSPTSTTSSSALYSTWYPTLERTVTCLSRLYRCVDSAVFKYLAQDAVGVCTATLIAAAKRVATHAHSTCDGLLFLIKQLLTLRQQVPAHPYSLTARPLHVVFISCRVCVCVRSLRFKWTLPSLKRRSISHI